MSMVPPEARNWFDPVPPISSAVPVEAIVAESVLLPLPPSKMKFWNNVVPSNEPSVVKSSLPVPPTTRNVWKLLTLTWTPFPAVRFPFWMKGGALPIVRRLPTP